LWLGCVAYALCYAALSLGRFSSFHAQIDLSYYVRLVWGLGHGRWDLPLVAAPHVLGLHLEPILLPLALLGRLGLPIAPLLLIVQAVVVALLPLPLFRLARRHLHSESAALGLALLSLLYPTVTVATLHDFHPVTLTLTLLAAWLDALDEQAWRRALLWGALALACREDIAVQLALPLCFLAWTQPKLRLRLVVLAGLLLLYFVLYIVVVQPRFVPKLGSYALHFASGGAKVSSGRELLLLLLQQPLRFLVEWLTWDRLRYVLELLWPLGFLPLLGVRYALGALPVLAINFLSSFPRVRSIESHYTTAMVPFLLVAAVVSLGKLVAWYKARYQREATAPLLALLSFLLIASHVLHGGSPLAWASRRYDAAQFVDGPEASLLRSALAKVPAQASVAARPGPLAHLAARARVVSPPEYDDGQPVEIILTPDATPSGQPRIGNQAVRH